ncbi:MAG TPA: hypothetical protein VGK73_03135 [Polyangiaceae bacterium]
MIGEPTLDLGGLGRDISPGDLLRTRIAGRVAPEMKSEIRALTAGAAVVLCACSRASSPPLSESAVKPSQSAPSVAAQPEPVATSSASAEAPAPTASTVAPAAPASAVTPASASAPAPAASAAPPNPWTTADDCARFENAPEYKGLSAEDRARSRSTCEAKEEFRAFVSARQKCSSANECTNLSGACPFGCFVPVAKSSASAVKTKLETLGARLDKAGNRCVYRCMGAPAEACVDGRCALAPR